MHACHFYHLLFCDFHHFPFHWWEPFDIERMGHHMWLNVAIIISSEPKNKTKPKKDANEEKFLREPKINWNETSLTSNKCFIKLIYKFSYGFFLSFGFSSSASLPLVFAEIFVLCYYSDYFRHIHVFVYAIRRNRCVQHAKCYRSTNFSMWNSLFLFGPRSLSL